MTTRRRILFALSVAALVPGWLALVRTFAKPASRTIGAAQNYANPIGPSGYDGGPANQIMGPYPSPTVAMLPATAGPPGTCPVYDDAGTLHSSTTCGGPDGAAPVAQYAPANYNDGTNTYLVEITGPTDGGPTGVPATGAHLDYAADASPLFTQDPTTAAKGGAIEFAPQASTAADGGGGPFTIGLAAPVGAGPAAYAQVNLKNPDGGAPSTVARLMPSPDGSRTPGCIQLGSTAAPTNNQFCDIWNDPTQNGPLWITATSVSGNSRIIFGGWPHGTFTEALILLPNDATTSGSGAFLSQVPNFTFAAGMYSAPLFTQTAPSSDVAPQTWTMWAESACPNGTCSTPTNAKGSTQYLGGGAANNPGTYGTSGATCIATNHNTSQCGIVTNEVATGRFAECFGGTTICTATNIPTGSGITFFANTSAPMTGAPVGGVGCWSDPTNGLTCWYPGASSPVVLGSGGGGCSLTGDVNGACGANTLTSITGNGSGVVGVTANVFNYTNGGDLEWTSNGSAEFQATGGNVTINSTGGIAYLTGNTTSIQSAAASSLTAGTSITESAGTTFSAIAGGTTLALSGVNSSLSGGTGGLNMSAAANVSLTSTGTGSAALIATGGNVLVSAGGTALFGATGQLSLASSSSVYVNAGAGQYQHLQIGGFDQITLESDGNVNFANAPSVSVPAPYVGQYCPKPAGAFTIKVNGTLHTIIYY